MSLTWSSPALSKTSQSRRSGRVVVAAVAVASLAGTVGLAPEPDAVPRRWQLDVTFSPLRIFSADIEGKGAKSFFYLTYQVSNNSGKDVLFAPSFDLVTGDKPIRSGRDVPGEVTKSIMNRSQNPLIQDQISILGNILQGTENAKAGVVVWLADNLQPDRMVVYAAGFSGETASVKPPAGVGEPILLRKTKMLRYEIKGELVGQGESPIVTVEDRWIMR